MNPSVMSSSQPPKEDVWRWLQEIGEQPATFTVLIDLHRRNSEYFYHLAFSGLPAGVPAWAKDINELASVVRRFVRFGFRLDEQSKQIVGTDRSLYLAEAEFDAARKFLQLLAGTWSKDAPGRDYAGSEVSSAEVRFTVGTAEEYRTDKAQSVVRNDLKPRLLRLAEQDIEAVRHGMPPYVAHELKQCARRVVQAPTVVFQGLRLGGPLSAGRAYCGRPRKAFNNDGKAVPAPAGMVYCAYADPDGYVFDWDWSPEDQERPGYPEDYRIRFANQITEPSEAVLLLPSDLEPSLFKKSKAWHSHRGDCMFFYASDVPAFAKRLNDDLTEYRTVGSHELVGCKVKNFADLLSKVPHMRSSTSSVPVSAVLAASLVRQMADHQQREKSIFLNLIAETALRMDNEQRTKFFNALLQLDARSEQYLPQLCDMVLTITQDRDHPMLRYAGQSLEFRRAIEEQYLKLIAVAGSASVKAAAA